MKYNKDLTEKKLLDLYIGYNPNSPFRFGQLICNHFLEMNEADPEVFYERNNGVAYKMILGRISENVS